MANYTTIEEDGLTGWVQVLGPGEAAELSHQAFQQAQAWAEGIHPVIDAFVEGAEHFSPVDEYSSYEMWAPLGVPDNPTRLGVLLAPQSPPTSSGSGWPTKE